MPVVACLGWGSLIWSPRKLRLLDAWQSDGPRVHVELLRLSRGGRVTFVLDEAAGAVPSFWARMDAVDIDAAALALAEREETSRENIGVWRTGAAPPPLIEDLVSWAEARGVDAVVWTALGGTFANFNEVLAFLKARHGSEKTSAEQYVRFAPRQIRTPHREALEIALGWTPQLPPSASEPYARLAYAVSPTGGEPKSVGHEHPGITQASATSSEENKGESFAEMPTFIASVLADALRQDGADAQLLAILTKHIVTMSPSTDPVESAFTDLDRLAAERATEGPRND